MRSQPVQFEKKQMEEFNAYHKWLGIPRHRQPPGLYQLLGLADFESDLDVIEGAVERQVAFVRQYQAGRYGAHATQLLNELANARLTLLKPETKQSYDVHLRAKLESPSIDISQFTFEKQPKSDTASGRSRRRLMFSVGIAVAAIVAIGASLRVPGRSGMLEVEIEEIGSSIQILNQQGVVITERENDRPKLQFAVAPGQHRLLVEKDGFTSYREDFSISSGKTTSLKAIMTSAKGTSPQEAERPSIIGSVTPSFVTKPPAPSQTMTPGSPIAAQSPAEMASSLVAPATTHQETSRETFAGPAEDRQNSVREMADSASRTRLAIPLKQDQEVAEQLIKDVFKADLAKAKTPADRLMLARKLLDKAVETQDDPVAKYLLLQMANDLAINIGAIGIILNSAEQSAITFDVDDTQLLDSLTKAAKVARPVKPSQNDLAKIMTIIELAIDNGDFPLASKYTPVATFVGRNLSSDAFKVVAIRSSEIELLSKSYPAVKAARTTRETLPDDPEASLTEGKYLCFLNGDWDIGLKLLAQGSDDTLKSLAEKELSNLTGAAHCTAIADGWWQVAIGQTGLVRAHVATHADSWYQKISGKSSVMVATKLEQRRKELDAFIASTSLANRVQDLTAAPDTPKHAVTQGRFTVWTEPHPIVPGRKFEVVIQVRIPPHKSSYNATDLSGMVAGSDGYKNVIQFKQGSAIPVINGQATLRWLIPGAHKGVRTFIRLESKSLNEKQTFDVE